MNISKNHQKLCEATRMVSVGQRRQLMQLGLNTFDYMRKTPVKAQKAWGWALFLKLLLMLWLPQFQLIPCFVRAKLALQPAKNLRSGPSRDHQWSQHSWGRLPKYATNWPPALSPVLQNRQLKHVGRVAHALNTIQLGIDSLSHKGKRNTNRSNGVVGGYQSKTKVTGCKSTSNCLLLISNGANTPSGATVR